MTTDDRLSKLQPHQQEFHKVLVDDFEQLSVKYRNSFVTELEHRDRARYAQLDEIRRQTDARHDALLSEIDTLVSVVKEVAVGCAAADVERKILRAEVAQLREELQVYMMQLPPEERARLIAIQTGELPTSSTA